ncbi:MAG: single-stranded DNA-binding protein [Myxococcota bacterium]|jgi:single-strand selective monofunctional uracil DNA glycosylase|nr:single-stranded DNA-binding protein [Myxococcota bacterium]
MPTSLLVESSRKLSQAVDALGFGDPVAVVYNPLNYARDAHEAYLERFGRGRRRVVFLGMNPGPFGMAQTGVPFGEIAAVRDWMCIHESVGRPAGEHPKRPVSGFDCPRSEVSGRRLWGAVKGEFGEPEKFFEHHFVANYCPLVFMEQSGKNRTPDRLPRDEREALFEVCDRRLVDLVAAMEPAWVVGVGRFAAQRARSALEGGDVQVGVVLHPSPASPMANRDWEGTVRRQLVEQGICDSCPRD